jgi:fumarate reductase subunit D
MAKSNKPLVWGPFAAGGTVSAFVTPVLIVLTLLAATGRVPELLTYDHLRAFASHGLVKIAIAGVVFLTLWGAAHRLRITIYDVGVRADTLVATIVYAIAIIATISAVASLAVL